MQLIAVTGVAYLIANFRFCKGRGSIPVVADGADQKGNHQNAGDDPGDPTGFRMPFTGDPGTAILAEQSLPTDGVGGTNADAFAATDTFLIAYMVDIHFTVIDAEIAVDAFAVIYGDTEDGDLIKQTVKGTKWANETAEHSKNKYATDDDAHHHEEFPSEDGAEHGKIACVHLVRQKGKTTFDGSGWANVFAESRQGFIPESVCNGYDQNEEDKDHVFQVG